MLNPAYVDRFRRLAAKMHVEQRTPTISASAETYVHLCANTSDRGPSPGAISRSSGKHFPPCPFYREVELHFDTQVCFELP